MALQPVPVATKLGGTSYTHRQWHGVLTETRYAHPDGNNANDGLTWGSAKQYILNAYDALPSTGGTLRIANGTNVGGEVAEQGIWIVGPNDVNYASPPTGWRQQKPVHFIGTPASAGPQFSKPTAAILGGTTNWAYDGTTKPVVWLAGTSSSLIFENLAASYVGIGLRVGVGTNNDRSVNTSMVQFRNIGIATYNTGVFKATPGNPVDLGYLFWGWFEYCTFHAYSPAAQSADARAAIMVKPDPAGESSGLIFFRHTVTAGGGLKYYIGNTSWSLHVEDLVHEGDFVSANPPAVWLLNPNVNGVAYLDGVQHADVGVGSDPTIVIGSDASAGKVLVLNTVGGVTGPHTRLNDYDGANDLAKQRATGFEAREVGAPAKIVGQHDGHRRMFGPTAAWWVNLADQDVTTWSSKPGAATVTTGQADPAGGTNAARLSSASLLDRQVYRASRTVTVGDWFMAGVWVRSPVGGILSSPGSWILAQNPAGSFTLTDSTSGYFGSNAASVNEWEWHAGAYKVATVTISPCEIIFSLRSDNGLDQYYFAPILLHISAGTFSDDEVMERLYSLGSWDNNLVQGDVGLLKNQNLVFPGNAYIQFSEQADAAAPAVNKARLYSKDNGSGKTQLVVRFPTGAVQVIATEP